MLTTSSWRATGVNPNLIEELLVNIQSILELSFLIILAHKQPSDWSKQSESLPERAFLCPTEEWGPGRPLQPNSMIRKCVKVCINVDYDWNEFNEKEECMCMYRLITVCSRNVVMMGISVIYECLSWGSDQQQDLGKPSWKAPSQAIDGKLLSVLSHMVGKTTQSTLRREQGWTH